MLGIGTDLVDIARFRRSLIRTPGLSRRLFTQQERAYCERARDPSARYAARFAAKEATLKALGLGLGAVAMREIEVIRHRDGRPELVLHRAALAVATRRGVGGWLVTISHTDELAQATVVALGES